jgi:hypothetical protein
MIVEMDINPTTKDDTASVELSAWSVHFPNTIHTDVNNNGNRIMNKCGDVL